MSDHDRLVAVGAVEIYPDGGLLRSVVVSENERGTGLGRRIVESLVENAKTEDLGELWLLTDTAESFFSHLGFEVAKRGSAPRGVAGSSQFGGCSPSATAMRLVLG